MSDSIEMIDIEDKKEVEQVGEDATEPFPELSSSLIIQREIPDTWRYKRLNVFGLFRLPMYASPVVQLFMVAFISFMNPGLYNALSGLGGAGQLEARVFDLAQTGLYATFAVVAFNSGSVVNVLGIRLTLTLGSLGYALFASSFLCFNHTQNWGFVIFSGIFLGISAGFFWTAQGAVMISYPSEQTKGRYIGYFWALFNLGAVIGSIVPLSANFYTDRAETVNDKTYIAFIVLMVCGGFSALLMCDGKDVVRSDGSWVEVPKAASWKVEVWAMWYTLQTDTYIILLFPMFFCSNWFYTYQFNGINLAHFNTRTRALNNLVYWSAQIAGACAFGFSVDTQRFRRTVKAKVSWVMLFCLTMVVWGGGFAWQKSVPDRKNLSSAPFPVIDWADPDYWQGMLLYMSYGFFDAVWQSFVYWIMGALTNSTHQSANFAGFYKGLQSAGAAAMWRMDSLGTPFMTEFLTNWILLASSLLIAMPVIFLMIDDSPEEEEPQDDRNEADNDTEDHAVDGAATGIDPNILPDLPRQRLQPREDHSLPISISQMALNNSGTTLTEDLVEELPLTTAEIIHARTVSKLTLKEAVVELDDDAPKPEVAKPAPTAPTPEEFHGREVNRFSRAFGDHRRAADEQV